VSPARRVSPWLLLGLVTAFACGSPEVASAPSRDQLFAVAWAQSSVEADAAIRATYRSATRMLDPLIAEPEQRAAIEQVGSVKELTKLAVIVDVDETVLDNLPYQAWAVATGRDWSPDTWGKWVDDRVAPAIPGAAAFLRAAADRGITVFYVTNRSEAQEPSTRANLVAHGFPMTPGQDTILSRINTSEKGVRRSAIAGTHRILMLIGDNLGDFVDGYKSDAAHRRHLLDSSLEHLGHDWFVIPNPVYGSWPDAMWLPQEPATTRQKHELMIAGLERWKGP